MWRQAGPRLAVAVLDGAALPHAHAGLREGGGDRRCEGDEGGGRGGCSAAGCAVAGSGGHSEAGRVVLAAGRRSPAHGEHAPVLGGHRMGEGQQGQGVACAFELRRRLRRAQPARSGCASGPSLLALRPRSSPDKKGLAMWQSIPGLTPPPPPTPGQISLVRLITAYETVLERMGLEASQDVFYYRFLLKLALDPGAPCRPVVAVKCQAMSPEHPALGCGAAASAELIHPRASPRHRLVGKVPARGRRGGALRQRGGALPGRGRARRGAGGVQRQVCARSQLPCPQDPMRSWAHSFAAPSTL